MNIAFLGCGFIADEYRRTLESYPQLHLAGVYDRDADRLRRFSEHHQVRAYTSCEQMLDDSAVDIVVNLTNPRSHYETNLAALEAGKHVYCEKPLAMRFKDAQYLVQVARDRKLQISSAPCNVLSETAQTLWKALRDGVVGTPRLVYAELDDGFVPQMPYKKWISESGAPWPHRDEFEIGCTLEHAGYYLSWLAAFFGPATSVNSFTAETLPDKAPDSPRDAHAPDFSVASLRFRSGVTARLTCSIVAPHDHAMRIFGDRGILSTEDCWRFQAPVYLGRRIRIRRRLLEAPIRRRLRLRKPEHPGQAKRKHPRDFARGIADLADAIAQGRPPTLSPEFSLHVTELALAIHHASDANPVHHVQSTFDPLTPMPWAAD